MSDDVEAFWDNLYLSRASGENIWSGQVNAQLATEVDGLAPGRALDLGCGEGGDAVHLARLGWQVTAVDVSRTALSRAAAAAAAAGLDSRIDFERHDLTPPSPRAGSTWSSRCSSSHRWSCGATTCCTGRRRP